MLIFILLGLLIFATAITYWGQLNGGVIHIALLMGIALAAIYSYVDYEEEEITEYTLQCCILFVSITVIWERPMNG